METRNIQYFERFEDFCKGLSGAGAFLVVQDAKGKPNPMTIGWAAMGPVWGEAVLAVLVRPSRHTHGLIGRAKVFSVNVPIDGLRKELAFCGSRSGRDVDKVKACGLKVLPGRLPQVSVLADCGLFYECEVVVAVFGLFNGFFACFGGFYFVAAFLEDTRERSKYRFIVIYNEYCFFVFCHF